MVSSQWPNTHRSTVLQTSLPAIPSKPISPRGPDNPVGPGRPSRPGFPFSPLIPGIPGIPFNPGSPLSPGIPERPATKIYKWTHVATNLSNCGFKSHWGAWMSVCCECCALSGRGLCDELITHPELSYRLWCVVVCDLDTSWMRRPWPTGGCWPKTKLQHMGN